MPWFRVDDQFATHQKAVEAGNAACGLWVRAGSWSAAQLTDGQIPARLLPVLGARVADARKLVHAGLWHDHGHGCDQCPQPEAGGYVFHGWPEFQPTRADTERKRAEARERMQRNRAGGSRDVRANSERTSRGVRPTPARPDPTHAAAAASDRGSSGQVLPGDLDVLRSKMCAYTALAGLRWDKLTDDQVTEIQDLIARHGDTRLVEWAVRTCRTPPPVHASAFIGTWQAIDTPRLVTTSDTRCAECGRTETACRAADANLDPADRHEFQEAS